MIAAGRIVGGYSDANGSHGYLLADGDFQTIDCPKAPGGVFLSAIDSLGRMAGEMTTADGHQHGLVVSNGECIAVDFPGSVSTYANSIDPLWRHRRAVHRYWRPHSRICRLALSARLLRSQDRSPAPHNCGCRPGRIPAWLQSSLRS